MVSDVPNAACADKRSALAANGAQRTMLALALACGWTDGERAPAELADTEHGGFVADYARRHLKRQREMDSEAELSDVASRSLGDQKMQAQAQLVTIQTLQALLEIKLARRHQEEHARELQAHGTETVMPPPKTATKATHTAAERGRLQLVCSQSTSGRSGL